jgi:hypothetical protein
MSAKGNAAVQHFHPPRLYPINTALRISTTIRLNVPCSIGSIISGSMSGLKAADKNLQGEFVWRGVERWIRMKR